MLPPLPPPMAPPAAPSGVTATHRPPHRAAATLLTRFLRLLRWGSYFVPGRVRARGKTASRGRARRARAALKFSEFHRGKADFKRAIGRDLQVPRSVKDAAPIYGGVAHLSLWKPKRATNWVIPRFEPGESQILTHASHHP